MSSVRIGERYNNGVDNTVFNPRAKIECIVQCYNKHTTGKSFKQNFKICKTFKYYELVVNVNCNATIIRYFVLYWFLDGHSLFQVIEDNIINNYVIYCRILFGMVKGLVYLRRIG
jgi:hypothetical protein